MASQKTFSERVNYAARWIVSGRPTTRSFDNCFENSDGDAVVLALCRRAEKNERLRQALPRYIAESSIRDVPARYAGRNPADVSREQRAACRAACVKDFGEEFAATVYGPPEGSAQGRQGGTPERENDKSGSQPAHTPGPWRATREAGAWWEVYADTSRHPVCHVTKRVDEPSAPLEADARLIAAAPALLAACRAMLLSSGLIGNQPDVLEAVQQMRVAVEAATPRS